MQWMNISILYLIFCINCSQSISLNGKWKGIILSTGTSFDAEVPGGIYSDLERNGLIEQNLVEFNDIKNRWVANTTVAYITTFKVNSVDLNAPYIVLILHGLDTFSTIYVNGIKVGSTTNMFLRYNFNIKNNLKIMDNELKIIFESSVKVSEKMYNEQSKKYIVYPKCVPKTYNGECHINHIRKMQASYGWDWGPAFPSMGIWKNVELEIVQNVLVLEITVDTFKTKNFWRIVVTIFFESFGKNIKIEHLTHILCTLEELNLKNSTYENLTIINNHANATISLEIPINKVEKWWPNGYGQQRLYSVNVKVQTGTDITKKIIKIGFRTVELIQKSLKKGLSFYFKVNDVAIFAKGSNWIPSSIFPEHLEKQEILKHLLGSAKKTNMNMLRVWGGGVYESELFYSLADIYGIMIWQDFMFACNMYPTTEFFLNDVRKEVSHNMKRLKHHPSIVLWAGNNENEAALYGNWYGTGSEQIYRDDYIKLYKDTIKSEAINNDLVRPFVISSPSNGLYSEEKNYTQSNPYSTFYGDVHYYNYLRNGWDINQYPVTRFASEYGFQALPSIWTIISATKNFSHLQLNSSFFEHRQHLPGGYEFMKLLISKNFIIPVDNNNTLIQLIDYIYLSQVTQAVSIKIQTESYRQMKSSFNELGEGLTMGALYWQLNDVWQAPSWSSIDFQGRWKMLHYYAKDFFHPVIVTSKLSAANELSIYIVSDLLYSLTNLTVEVNVYEWKSAKCIHTKKINNVTIGPNKSQLVGQYWIDNFLEAAGCGSLVMAKEKCMLELILKDVNGTQKAPTNYVYPITLKNVTLPKDFLTINIKPEVTVNDHYTDFQVEISSPSMALFIWLEVGNINGHFSDNGFHIFHGIKNITFHAYQSSTVNSIKKNLIVTTLSRIYDSELRKSDIKIFNHLKGYAV